MTNRTILVTGGAGYIGSHTSRQLREAGENIVVLDNLSTGFKTAVLDAELIIIGNGPAARTLQKLAASVGVDDRVRFVDNQPQARLVRYYNAADALVLASVSEGMPNVLLEAIACGTPVIATATGGAKEIISRPAAGELMRERQAPALIEAFSRLREQPPDRTATRRHRTRSSDPRGASAE